MVFGTLCQYGECAAKAVYYKFNFIAKHKLNLREDGFLGTTKDCSSERSWIGGTVSGVTTWTEGVITGDWILSIGFSTRFGRSSRTSPCSIVIDGLFSLTALRRCLVVCFLRGIMLLLLLSANPDAFGCDCHFTVTRLTFLSLVPQIQACYRLTAIVAIPFTCFLGFLPSFLMVVSQQWN